MTDEDVKMLHLLSSREVVFVPEFALPFMTAISFVAEQDVGDALLLFRKYVSQITKEWRESDSQLFESIIRPAVSEIVYRSTPSDIESLVASVRYNHTVSRVVAEVALDTQYDSTITIFESKEFSSETEVIIRRAKSRRIRIDGSSTFPKVLEV